MGLEYAEPVGPPPSRVQEPLPRGIWVLVAAAGIIAIGYGLIAPVLPQYAHSFNVSVTAAAAIISVFGITRLVFAPASGSLVNRLGERPMYMTGLLIVALSTFATAHAQNYWELLVFRGAGGIGSTLFTVSATGMIVRMSPPHMRGRASAAYGGAFLFGGITGPVLGGILGDVSLRLPFYVYTVTLLIAIAVVWWQLPAQTVAGVGPTITHAGDTAGDGDKEAATPQQEPYLRLRDVTKDSAYWACLVSFFANGWGNFGVRVALLPLFVAFLTNSPGTSQSGIAMALFAAGNGLALYTTRRWSDRWGRRPLIIGGLVLCGVMTLLLGLGGDINTVYVLSLFAGLGGGMTAPAQQAAIGDVVHGHRGGTVLASVQMAADFGAIVGTLAAGAIADHWGYSWAFGITAIIMVVSSVAWIPAREPLPASAREKAW